MRRKACDIARRKVQINEKRNFRISKWFSGTAGASGRTLAADLAARGLSANALALKLRVPSNRLSDIVRGHRAISLETALRLGRYLGTGGRFWMNLQVNYELALAQRVLGETIAREVEIA
jgi:addiction module HigA family antidote